MEASVAEIFWATKPGLPMPVITTRPVQPRIHSTARAKGSPRRDPADGGRLGGQHGPAVVDQGLERRAGTGRAGLAFGAGRPARGGLARRLAWAGGAGGGESACGRSMSRRRRLRARLAGRYGGPSRPLPETPHMKFFIDSADLGEIKKALDLGLCDGVTTNPSLVAKTGRKFDDVLKEIVALKPGPISAEVTALDCDGMLKEAEHYAKFGHDVVIKIPLIVEGLKAVKVAHRRAASRPT